MVPECLLPYSQELANGTYSQRNIRISYVARILTPYFLLTNLNVTLLSISRSSNWVFLHVSLLNFILISQPSHA